MKELGCANVGDRIIFLEFLKLLKKHKRDADRSRALWSGTTPVCSLAYHRGCASFCFQVSSISTLQLSCGERRIINHTHTMSCTWIDLRVSHLSHPQFRLYIKLIIVECYMLVGSVTRFDLNCDVMYSCTCTHTHTHTHDHIHIYAHCSGLLSLLRC